MKSKDPGDCDRCRLARGLSVRRSGQQCHFRAGHWSGQVHRPDAEWARVLGVQSYEGWQTVSISHNEKLMAVILANPAMINAYQSGIPGNGTPFPDGSKMAKIHWNPKKLETLPTAMVPAGLHDVDFMVKDSTRFADSGGWGWAAFKYDTASDTFTPFTLTDQPPQGNDAKCGLACHTIVKSRDCVFTDYGKR